MSFVADFIACRLKKRKEKRIDSAGSDVTGGKQLKRLMCVRGVVCCSTWTQSLTVVACIILHCIPFFYECRCMSDGVIIRCVSIF
jgi:hypothetical protein